MASVKSTVVLITGANKGLGFGIAQALLASPDTNTYKIFIASRSLDRASTAVKTLQTETGTGTSVVVPVQLDIDDDASIAAAHDYILKEAGSLDVLVNNAGVNHGTGAAMTGLTQREAFTKDFGTNVASTSAVTSAFIPLLLQSSQPRIVFVSSSVASLASQTDTRWPINAPPTATGWPKPADFSLFTYRTSKTALNMVALEWARILTPDGVKVHLVCPGLVATDLGGSGHEVLRAMGAKEPIDAGKFIKTVIDGARDADIGKLVSAEGVVPW